MNQLLMTSYIKSIPLTVNTIYFHIAFINPNSPLKIHQNVIVQQMCL